MASLSPSSSSSAPSFRLQDMTPGDPQWDDLFRTMSYSFEHPMQSMFRLFRPVFDSEGLPFSSDTAAEEESLKEFGPRMRFEYGADGIYQKVTSSEGKLVGGALWKVYDKNPFADEEDYTVTWYPEGGQRDFVKKALDNMDAPRAKYGARPQVFLNIIWVLPEYQYQGIGALIMDWGIKKADEMNVEMWLDASPYGRKLYEKHGFTALLKHDLSPAGQAPNEEWAKAKASFGEMPEVVMWRPAGGPYIEGKHQKPF